MVVGKLLLIYCLCVYSICEIIFLVLLSGPLKGQKIHGTFKCH